MIQDVQNVFSDAQALTATAVSTNVVDLGADNNVGVGEPMAVVIQLTVAADATTGDETYTAAIKTDDNSGLSSATTLGTLTIAAGAAAGTRYQFVLPKDTTLERYLRVDYTLGGTTPTVTVDAWLTPLNALEKAVNYADNITIS